MAALRTTAPVSVTSLISRSIQSLGNRTPSWWAATLRYAADRPKTAAEPDNAAHAVRPPASRWAPTPAKMTASPMLSTAPPSQSGLYDIHWWFVAVGGGGVLRADTTARAPTINAAATRWPVASMPAAANASRTRATRAPA